MPSASQCDAPNVARQDATDEAEEATLHIAISGALQQPERARGA